MLKECRLKAQSSLPWRLDDAASALRGIIRTFFDKFFTRAPRQLQQRYSGIILAIEGGNYEDELKG